MAGDLTLGYFNRVLTRGKGSTLKTGNVTLTGATPVVVANTNVTANSQILLTLRTVGGTVSPNAPNVLTKTPNVGFTVGGTALDTSVYTYLILNTN